MLVNIPVFVNKNYDIPEFVDKNTLAIIISYSGNTEETISAYEKVKGKTKKRVIIASGGILGGEKNVIKVPPGLPPRYSLPFLFFSMLSVLNNSEIVKKDFDLEEVVKNLESVDHDEAKSFAKSLIAYTLIFTLLKVTALWLTGGRPSSTRTAKCSPIPKCFLNITIMR